MERNDFLVYLENTIVLSQRTADCSNLKYKKRDFLCKINSLKRTKDTKGIQKMPY